MYNEITKNVYSNVHMVMPTLKHLKRSKFVELAYQTNRAALCKLIKIHRVTHVYYTVILAHVFQNILNQCRRSTTKFKNYHPHSQNYYS